LQEQEKVWGNVCQEGPAGGQGAPQASAFKVKEKLDAIIRGCHGWVPDTSLQLRNTVRLFKGNGEAKFKYLYSFRYTCFTVAASEALNLCIVSREIH
jgi:hypothetical protein